nr:MAG TPA: hypothetical protein [Caudoviricetes sp.]
MRNSFNILPNDIFITPFINNISHFVNKVQEKVHKK